MKREDIARIFPDATKEQISEILNLNGTDINQVRANAENLQRDLTAVQSDLTAARNTIAELEKVKDDAEKLQGEIDRYKQAESDRAAAEQQAAVQAKIEQRFGKALGERKIINDYVRRGLLEDFGKALQDDSNTGKSDAEVFAGLVKDQNLFTSMNPPADMPGFNPDLGGGETDALSDAEYYARVFNKK